ncbi:MAG TPA: type I-D CRISPR-associated protein Cas10d/Csc3 [Ktedonobacterales bacterium]|jgi:CRISPR-associated protein Csc3
MDGYSFSDYFQIDAEGQSLLQDYLETVAKGPFRRYKALAQYGKKAGESLYTHILDGILTLNQLCSLVALDDTEMRTLFTAFTLHDINKLDTWPRKNFVEIATPENVERFISEFRLNEFFPGYLHYLQDIVELILAHPGHSNYDVARLDLTRAHLFGLSLERLKVLIHLIRSADNLDLSQTLDEWRGHKDKFLSEFNMACDDTQYEFFTHRLTEHRGLLTNIIHNNISQTLQERCQAMPLLLYPEGIAYLVKRGSSIIVDDAMLADMAGRITSAIQAMTRARFEDFIEVRPLGIRINEKCLELGIPFSDLMQAARSIIERRRLDATELRQKAQARAERRLADIPANDPRQAATAALLANPTFVPDAADRLRAAEAIRTYYIFLNEHFSAAVADPWARLYDLFQLPQDQRAGYEAFDPRLDRAYVVINDVALSTGDIWERIIADGSALLGQRQNADPRIPLFVEYVQQTAQFGSPAQEERPNFQHYLKQYTTNQHRQCVQCSAWFPTEPWMKSDVRSEISVNTFSNRLAGGPGEPKKYICALCQVQFLVEKLAFQEVRGEHIFYLHLYPYSFLPAAFIEGVRANVQRDRKMDATAQAFFLRPEDYIAQYAPKEAPPELQFLTQTKAGKPHVNGLYLPNYSETIGNLIIEPINPPGDNDTERFLYVLQMALLLQRHRGLKALVSESPIPPLRKDDFRDLYLDLQPLSMQGLTEDVNFSAYQDGDQPGNLEPLWERMKAIMTLRKHLNSIKDKRNPVIELARALTTHPLEVFYVAERLLDNRMSEQRSFSKGQQIFTRIKEARILLPALEQLAKATKGGQKVASVSDQLQQLATIAWAGGLRGRSLEKHSLMVPFNECLNQLSHPSKAFDEAAIRATINMEIFEYLKRTAKEGYKPGARKREAIRAFVDTFFDGLYGGVYDRNKALFLNDERRLRSAYLFYIWERIPHKGENLPEDSIIDEPDEPDSEEVLESGIVE